MAMSMNAKRRTLEFAVLAVIVLIPVLGILRIDVTTGRFIVFNHYVLWGNFPLIFGSGALLIAAFALIYTLWGNAFCGWACPQNTLSELVDKTITRWIGKRTRQGMEQVDPEQTLAQRKGLSGWWRWLPVLGLAALLGMFFALIPLLYFLPPQAVWAFVTFADNVDIPPYTGWLFSLFAFAFFVDFAMVRHFYCKYLCVYALWQHIFKTDHTVRISFDETRLSECPSCQACSSSCFLGIDPRDVATYTHCVNCGQCIEACAGYQGRQGRGSILSFAFGHEEEMGRPALRSRLQWLIPAFLGVASMLVYGLSQWESGHLAMAAAAKWKQPEHYVIDLSNKMLVPRPFSLAIKGLEPDQYRIGALPTKVPPGGRVVIDLWIAPETLPPGSHRLMAEARIGDDLYRDAAMYIRETP